MGRVLIGCRRSCGVWTDSTGQYTLDAKLVAFNDKSVVLQRDDHELVAIPIDKLSDKDREYLKSKEAGDAARTASEGLQTWTLRDGTKLVGRIVDFTIARPHAAAAARANLRQRPRAG